MDNIKRCAVPARLARVRKRFDAWRRTRRAGTRIPEPLWASAVKLAGTYWNSQTAVALKLHYELLKKWIEKKNSELPSPIASDSIFPTSLQNA